MKNVSETVTPAYMDVCQTQMSDPCFRSGLERALEEHSVVYYTTNADVGSYTARWCAGWNVGAKHTREHLLAQVPLDIAILISRELAMRTRVLLEAVAV